MSNKQIFYNVTIKCNIKFIEKHFTTQQYFVQRDPRDQTCPRTQATHVAHSFLRLAIEMFECRQGAGSDVIRETRIY